MIKRCKRQVTKLNGDYTKLSSAVKDINSELKMAKHEVKKDSIAAGVGDMLGGFFGAMATRVRERDVKKAFDKHRREGSQISFEHENSDNRPGSAISLNAGPKQPTHAAKVAHLRAAKGEAGSRAGRSSMASESFTNTGSVLVGEYVTKLKVKGMKQGLKDWARDELAE